MSKLYKNQAQGKADIALLVDALNKHEAGTGEQLSNAIAHLNNRISAQAGHRGPVAIAKQTATDALDRSVAGLDLNGNRLTGLAEPIEGKDIVTLDYWRKHESCDAFAQRFFDCVVLKRRGISGRRVNLIPGPGPTIMNFIFAGENAFAPGDGFLYTGNQVQGRFEIVNYRDYLPDQVPVEVSNYQITDFPMGFRNARVAVYGDTMYGMDKNTQLRVFSLNADRTTITLVNTVNIGTYADYILAYLHNGTSPILATLATTILFEPPLPARLTLFSLASPHSPGFLDDEIVPGGMFTSTGGGGLNADKPGIMFVLVPQSPTQLHAYDVSDPSDIDHLSSVAIPYATNFRSFYQSYGCDRVYICDGPGSLLRMWDVTDPDNMFETGTPAATSGYPVSVSVDNSFAFVVCNPGPLPKASLDIFDILDPDHPELVATFQMSSQSFYSYGLLTRDGTFTAHGPTTGLPIFDWFIIEC